MIWSSLQMLPYLCRRNYFKLPVFHRPQKHSSPQPPQSPTVPTQCFYELKALTIHFFLTSSSIQECSSNFLLLPETVIVCFQNYVKKVRCYLAVYICCLWRCKVCTFLITSSERKQMKELGVFKLYSGQGWVNEVLWALPSYTSNKNQACWEGFLGY